MVRHFYNLQIKQGDDKRRVLPEQIEEFNYIQMRTSRRGIVMVS